MSEAEEMYDRLKRVNEARGYFFSSKKEMTMELIEGLLAFSRLQRQQLGADLLDMTELARAARMNFEEADQNDDDELNDILWRAIRKDAPPPPVRSIFGR